MVTPLSFRELELLVLFLSLFIPAMVGVFGSFLLYLIQKFRRGNRVRISIQSEMESMEELDLLQVAVWPLSNFQVPTKIFEATAGDLGLLTDEEVATITAYYSKAETVNILLQQVELNPDIDVDIEELDGMIEELKEIDSSEEYMEILREYSSDDAITRGLQELGDRREEALNTIEAELERNEGIGLWRLLPRAFLNLFSS